MDYTTLTLDNFLMTEIIATSISGNYIEIKMLNYGDTYCNVGVRSGSVSNIKNYDPINGTLNFYISATVTGGTFSGSNCGGGRTGSTSASVHAYLVY